MKNIPRKVVRGAIRLYQLTLGPYLGGRCRFYPSCSCYGLEAVERHGALRGAWLTLVRLSKCHPFHSGGVDLVPDPKGVEAMYSGRKHKA
ncbi:MAG TPA: membrane protein insertion efficiency factor YidD [Kiritimatiellia bacterium]|nr:membrane protein insertion efficiency factor YidD [Kiritimatiellia bacterium]